MLRKLLIAAALAALAALPAAASRGPSAQIAPQTLLMPGVSYQRQVQFTPHGPVVLDVVTAPRPDGSTYTLAPALSNNAIVATQTLTDMQKDVSATSTAVDVALTSFCMSVSVCVATIALLESAGASV